MEIQGRINQANGRLRSAKVGVALEKHGNRLFLRGTLPPKPDSSRGEQHQQRITLGIYANPKGVSTAEKEAFKVGGELALRQFSWTPSRTRKRYCAALGALAKFAGVEFDAKAYRGKHTPTKVTPRDIPTDSAIAQQFAQIKNDRWRWAFGILATFGLRPHELFYLGLEQFQENIVTVQDGKTGRRQVWAIYPEWVKPLPLL